MPTTVIGASTGIDITQLKCTARGHCHGGVPGPALHDYPLLAWMHTGHHRHGQGVFTEDQAAAVHDVALALAETPSVEALAEKFHTTPNHVEQAIKYAVAAGALAAG